jgi:hypothetical protein
VKDIDEQNAMENVKIEELETRLREFKMEYLSLKETIENNEDLNLGLETRSNSLEQALKVEKNKNKKERQKIKQGVVYVNNEFKVKCESFEENDMIVYDIPTVNKFSPLVNLESDNTDRISLASQTESFKCMFCSEIFLMGANMIEHRARFHKQISANFSQTVTVLSTSRFQQTQGDSLLKDSCVEYDCFYGDITITSESFLSDHIGTCQGRNSLPVNTNRLLQNQCKSEQDQWDAIKTILIQMQSPKLPCDICHKEFESEGFVKLHKMSDHHMSIGDLM